MSIRYLLNFLGFVKSNLYSRTRGIGCMDLTDQADLNRFSLVFNNNCLCRLFFYCALTFSFFYGITAYAQQHNFTTYSVTEGLAQSQVQTILEDGKGYLWLGTQGGGLCRFDGAKFVTFTTKDGLKSNYIQTVFEDNKGVLWIGTSNGINQLKNGALTEIENTTLENLIVTAFLETANGIIYLTTKNGLYTIDNQQKNKPLEKIKDGAFSTLFKDAQQQIWVGGIDGLFIIKNKIIETAEPLNGTFPKDIRSLTTTKDGVTWIAAYNQGIFLSDGDKILGQLTVSDGLSSTKIQTLSITKIGDIWIGSADKGAMIWQTQTRNFKAITTRQGLPNNNVQSIVEDSWGNIWMGTSGGGLSKYGGQQFEHFTKTEGLNGNYIYALATDRKGQLWVATSSSGIQLYKEGVFTNFEDNSSIARGTCKAIFEDRLGHLWFGTDNGVTVFLDSLYLSFTAENGLSGNEISDITQDAFGNIWIASANKGISKISWNDSLPSQSIFTNFMTQNGLPNNQINDLYIDEQNRVWVATNGGGIVLIEKEEIIKVFTQKEGLVENIIRSFSTDDLGFLWYGTASYGIGNIDLNGAAFTVNNNYKGLISNNIKLLETDASNNLWVGSEKGLNYLQLDAARNIISKEFYGQREGFKGVETSLNAVEKDTEGNLWFGTVNGLTKYNKIAKKGINYPPKVYLQSIKLFDRELNQTPYGKKEKKWTNLNLPYDENELSFQVMGLHLSYPNTLQYQWKLEGVDKDWSRPTNNNNYQRTFLPDRYTLKVRATRSGDNSYSNILVFPFEISPPFWQKLPFKIGSILGSLLLISFFIKWRINIVRRKAKRIQDRLTLDKKRLELEQKALQLQMNPHFIFNALNSIQGAITPTDIKTARLQLAKFSKLMRATLENARTETITLEEEINTLTNYLSLEQFSRGDTFDYEITVADSIDTEVVYLPSMILQPFVENAIIHGVAHLDNRGKIEVEFARKGKRLSCRIEDNGIGRAKAKMVKSQISEGHKSVALAITRERLDLLRSGKSIKNSLQIIDLVDEIGNASGTRVEVIIPIEED